MDNKAMLIDRKQLRTSYGNLRVPGADHRPTTARPPSGTAKNAEAEVEVHVSSEAQLFGRLKGLLSQLPDVREDRVAEVRRKLVNGVYVIDSERLVDRMLGSD